MVIQSVRWQPNNVRNSHRTTLLRTLTIHAGHHLLQNRGRNKELVGLASGSRSRLFHFSLASSTVHRQEPVKGSSLRTADGPNEGTRSAVLEAASTFMRNVLSSSPRVAAFWRSQKAAVAPTRRRAIKGARSAFCCGRWSARYHAIEPGYLPTFWCPYCPDLSVVTAGEGALGTSYGKRLSFSPIAFVPLCTGRSCFDHVNSTHYHE